MSRLNRHPFPVVAFLEKSLVLGFAVPKSEVAHLIPDCLELDLFKNEWAFLAAAIVKTSKLRPKGFPKFLGRDFLLIGYRVFVRYRGADNRRLRGLYILGSETDKAGMQRLGSLFTQYRYRVLPIQWTSEDDRDKITTSAGLRVLSSRGDDSQALPEGSPFSDWREARRFCGPMPFTFSYDQTKRDVIIVEGVREIWKPTAVSVEEHHIPFLDSLQLDGLVLANAFFVENVPYEWKRGRIEKWKS